jgi:hypothetical protein
MTPELRLLDGLSEATQGRVLAFLEQITDRPTFVSIVPDDDGVAVLYWVAGDIALQVDITENGPDYLWVSVGGNARSVTAAEEVHRTAARVLSGMAATEAAARVT